MQQTTIFDAIEARERAEAGIAQAAENKASLLEFARGVARQLGRERGLVSADDVQRTLFEKHKISEHALGNAAGSLFKKIKGKPKEWHFDGTSFIKSERVASHGRYIRVWRYVGS
jgi:hypothetical protein